MLTIEHKHYNFFTHLMIDLNKKSVKYTLGTILKNTTLIISEFVFDETLQILSYSIWNTKNLSCSRFHFWGNIKNLGLYRADTLVILKLKFWRVYLEHFIEHKLWNGEQWKSCLNLYVSHLFFFINTQFSPKRRRASFSFTMHINGQLCGELVTSYQQFENLKTVCNCSCVALSVYCSWQWNVNVPSPLTTLPRFLVFFFLFRNLCT